MSVGTKLLQAAAGNAGGDPTYVDDVFSCFLYEGTGGSYGVNTSIVHGIQTGIRLGDSGVGTSTKFAHNTDFLSRSSDLTGNADGKTFTFSCWVFLTPKIDDNQRTLYATDSSDNGILIAIQSNNTLSMEAWNGGVRTLQLSTTTVLPTNAFTNILVSLDFANSSNRYIYFNDEAATVTYNTYNNANVEFTRSTHYIGIWGNGSTRGLHNDNLAHLYLDYTYRDLSTESNRRIFIDANGGSTAASTLAALNPIMYIPMTTAYAVGKNAGTGGDFTSNGSPTIVENGTEYVSGNGRGGLVWTKNRTNTNDHNLVDSVRGLTNSPYIRSNSNTSQGTDGNGIQTFNNNGHTVGRTAGWNESGGDLVSWTFAKQEKFFDIVTYTGNGSAGHAVSHNLGSVPGMILIKNLSAGEHWVVYHRGIGNTKSLTLSTTAAEDTSIAYWNNTDPTSTHFTLGTVGSGGINNESGRSYVAYLFAHDAQDFGTDSDEAIIKCDSYTGTGSAGNSINLGFEPQWLMIKQSSGANDWYMYDTMRGIVSGGNDAVGLKANSEDAEGSSNHLSVTATGFELEGTGGGYNGSGQTYVYMAIRRPNKPASEFAATDLFMQDNDTTTTSPKYDSGFPVDFALQNTVDETGYTQFSSRLTGKQMYTSVTDAEEGSPEYDYSTGFKDGGGSTNADDYAWMWRRAPGFVDVVAYAGNNTLGRTVAHNLGVTPELMIVKLRNSAKDWYVYSSSQGAGKRLTLNDNSAASNTGAFNDTAPTSASFTVGDGSESNGSGYNYIAYLFATADGISKVGTYTGTGSDLNVDCGFSAGARFVLIKRSDSTGDWYLYDSSRGIVAGDDPYLLLNSTAAQVTNTDYIDPLSSGFTVTSSAPAGLNASSGTYLFYAIA